ncbi:MAG: DUF4830 domain-containing protein [Oscillospiraceae bacterium]|nr:DUF4830 domain-containing protein [Oscillospiraceae bacterium]
MLLISLKSPKKFTRILVPAVIFIILSLVLFFVKPADTTANSPAGKYNICVKTDDDRAKFFSQFNWEVDPHPIIKDTVRIPERFNETYDSYSKIQREQGLNIEKCKGKICERFVYTVKNYESKFGEVRATILVRKNKVVAGDISSFSQGGFSHGFFKPDANKKNL